jgi:IstB-like ATP binding protein
VLDPYKSLIQLTLKDHPKLLATRLYDMITPRGYTGSVVQLRRYVRTIRPVGQGEAFFRLRTLPGEQAQVDWGCFGSLVVGKSKRPLSCFVMVLGWSRAVFAYFSLLVLDEVGYLAFDNRNADLLFQVVSRRYEKKSLVLTTNLAFSDWPTVFPSATCATALIDRVIHHADVIAIEGESYRLREAKEHAGRRHPAPRDDGAPKNKKK